MADDYKPVGVCFDFETRVVLGRAPLFNGVHVGEAFMFSNACVVAMSLTIPLLVGDKQGFTGAIGFGGVRGGRTVLRATKGMCVVVDESVSYHARSQETKGYEGRVC